jgi:gas vesicle protein
MKVQDIQQKATDIGSTVGHRAVEIGSTVGGRAKETGKALIIRTEGPRKAIAERAEGPRKAIAKRTRRTRRKVGYWIAGEEPKGRTIPVLAAAAAGAVAAYFLDPVSGKRRRHIARDRTASVVRRVREQVAKRGRYLEGKAEGLRHELATLDGDRVPENDATLAHKVESELHEDRDIPKSININAEEGVVVLRGTVPRPEQIEAIERNVRAIDGVRDVKNLLHLEGTPAPNR